MAVFQDSVLMNQVQFWLRKGKLLGYLLRILAFICEGVGIQTERWLLTSSKFVLNVTNSIWKGIAHLSNIFCVGTQITWSVTVLMELFVFFLKDICIHMDFVILRVASLFLHTEENVYMHWLRPNWSNSLYLLRRFTGVGWCHVAQFACALVLTSSWAGSLFV